MAWHEPYAKPVQPPNHSGLEMAPQGMGKIEMQMRNRIRLYEYGCARNPKRVVLTNIHQPTNQTLLSLHKQCFFCLFSKEMSKWFGAYMFPRARPHEMYEACGGFIAEQDPS